MATPLSLLNLGVSGLKRAKAREQLSPAEAWLMLNCRSYKGKVETAPGLSQFVTGTVAARPSNILAWQKDDDSYHLNIFTNTKIYSVHPTTGVISDITRAVGGDYTGSINGFWDAIAFQNIMIATDRADVIQKWDGAAAHVVVLGGTPPKASTLAGNMTYLILGDTDDATNGPRQIAWSDSGNAEAWTGGDAGSLILYQGPGRILRLLILSEIVVAYRTSSIHILFYIGPPFIWGQRQVCSDHGLIGRRAIANLGNRHIYWGTDNVYTFDGSTETPVGNDVIDEMKESYDPVYANNIHAVVDRHDHEVYFIYAPLGTSGIQTMSWVFNYMTGAWDQREIRASAAAVWSQLTGITWDAGVGDWDSQSAAWDDTLAAKQSPVVLIATDAGALRYINTDTVDNVGQSRDRYIETGLFDPGALLFQKPGYKSTLEKIEVDFEKESSYDLEVWVGTQDQLLGDADVTWTKYTIPLDGTKKIIPTRLTACYYTFRLRTSGAGSAFRVSGITAFFNERGDR